MSNFDIVPPAAIAAGDATDAYFDRTVETLEHAGKNPTVVAEVTASQFPSDDWYLFAGLKDAVQLFEGRDVTVDAIPEGRLFDGGPVMRITGPYLEFCRLETSLLGFLSHATGMATAALEARTAAPDSVVLSFGSRHVHPSLGAMLERCALLAGLDGISNVAAGDVIGAEAGGTMPHALVISFGRGNQEAAWQAFDEAVDDDVPRVALCDTYDDEIEEALRAAAAVPDLESVRIDTTGSRRGDFEHILRELRWKLDRRGHEDVGIFASGGIDPAAMRELRDIVEGFGVGSYISNADPLDFALDIAEVDGDLAAKRGKLDGKKEVYRTPTGEHEIRPADEDGDGKALFERVVEDGEIVASFDTEVAAERARTDAASVGFSATAESDGPGGNRR
ncbi:nicotinate phosphoribosyltransferase [Halovenus aranensis]|jgi:nicotinate phosphoribosyltransferase|uniref:Nicotinate phosphoribosyltransferase n=1 Tax=Halovenus aranensis TaxID=890420 RepID=A0A1G8Z2J4_9EURY|nr:nicotinate phosphoribosyltransferase [Halovenus aranensis]SDK08575.1 nicotinate phosphoribosyltransferase [Halovenus aranensis]